MRPIWKGSVGFGLVNIPISLYPATRSEELKFRLLRGKDLSPVNYKRVAEADGKEVPWGEIVKGYEYEKGKFVVLKEEDFKRADVEATQTVDIVADMSKKLREGKVFIDWSQNDDKKTTVTVYSLRAKERPTASTPLKWSEVKAALKAGKTAKGAKALTFEANDVLARVKKWGDLFAPVLTLKQRLPALAPTD